MKVCLVTPAPAGSRKGNRVTAERWAGLLRELGHEAEIEESWGGRSCDVLCDILIALHARRSAPSIERFHRQRPGAPLVVVLTGTDLYRDLADSAEARASLDRAWRLVVLQEAALAELPEPWRGKARVIVQSAVPVLGGEPDPRHFDVCVLGHLREVKDPFRTAEAARLLPASSRLRVLHAGAALEPGLEERARAEESGNPRYRWLGDLPRNEALALLARSRLLSLTSHLEGGANVISEAIAAGVPVVASRIAGSLGLLGPDYPGTFPVGDTAALAALLARAERDAAFYAELRQGCARLRPLVEPARERESWNALLGEIRGEP